MKYLVEIEIPFPEDLEDLQAELETAIQSYPGSLMPGESALEGVKVLSVVPNQNNRKGDCTNDVHESPDTSADSRDNSAGINGGDGTCPKPQCYYQERGNGP